MFFFSFSVKFNDTEIKQYALFLPSSVTSVLNGRGFSCIRTTQALHYIFIAVQTSKIYDFAFWRKKRDTKISTQKVSVFHPDSVFSTPCVPQTPGTRNPAAPRFLSSQPLNLYDNLNRAVYT